MSEKVLSVIAAFDGATTAEEYRRAKSRALRLCHLDQLCMVDSMKWAFTRLRTQGVL